MLSIRFSFRIIKKSLMKNKKILVFGSSGFLGNHLVQSLIKQNEVIEFDMRPPKKNITIQPLLKAQS